jgi:hypothetical protein
MAAFAAFTASTLIGCTQQSDRQAEARRDRPHADTVIVLAPVLNLSDHASLDPLQLTDIMAAEMQDFPGVAVVPVNLTLAALERLGLGQVETPQEAELLAREFDADATVVAAITEYDPYVPPRVGLVLQWYSAPRAAEAAFLDPVLASREPTGGQHALSIDDRGPVFQVQQVFNAAANDVQRDVQAYAARRAGAQSPYGWRLYVESQKQFVRYCAWSAFRTMLQVHDSHRAKAVGGEAP